MAKTILGKVTITLRGEYIPGEEYDRLDAVSSEGSSYISRIDNNTAPLTDTDAWMEWGRKGDKGDPLTWNDLTADQKDQLRGRPGDPLTWDDLTEEQRDALKGDPGVSVIIQEGVYREPGSTKDLPGLPAFEDTEEGSAYLVDDEEIEGQYDLYIHGAKGTAWTIVNNWGGVPGPRGFPGDKGEPGKPSVVLPNGNYGNWNEDTGEWEDSGIPAAATIDVDNLPVEFTAAEDDNLPSSGETIPTVFGRLARWLGRLGKFAFASTINWATDVSGKPEIPTKAYIDEADSALGGRITAETTRAAGAETALGEAIEDETTRAEDAEGSLGERLAAAQGIIAALTAELNEIRALAEQATKGIVFADTAQIDAWLAGTYTRPDGLTPAMLIVGQDLYTEALDEPDYWWAGTGYQTLQTTKVDLADYVRQQQLTEGLDGKVAKAGTSSTATTTAYLYGSTNVGGTAPTLKPLSTSVTAGHGVMRSTSGDIPVPSSVAWTANNAVGAKQVKAAIDDAASGFPLVVVEDPEIGQILYESNNLVFTFSRSGSGVYIEAKAKADSSVSACGFYFYISSSGSSATAVSSVSATSQTIVARGNSQGTGQLFCLGEYYVFAINTTGFLSIQRLL